MTIKLKPEEAFQIAVVKYLRAVLPSGTIVRGVEHGVKTSAITRQIQHAKGVRAGLPDLMLWWNGKHAHLELKAGDNKQQPSQVEFQELIEAQGFPYACCRTLKEIRDALTLWGWPLRNHSIPEPVVTKQPRRYAVSMSRKNPTSARALAKLRKNGYPV